MFWLNYQSICASLIGLTIQSKQVNLVISHFSVSLSNLCSSHSIGYTCQLQQLFSQSGGEGTLFTVVLVIHNHFILIISDLHTCSHRFPQVLTTYSKQIGRKSTHFWFPHPLCITICKALFFKELSFCHFV